MPGRKLSRAQGRSDRFSRLSLDGDLRRQSGRAFWADRVNLKERELGSSALARRLAFVGLREGLNLDRERQ
jgi:hypothetical protein